MLFSSFLVNFSFFLKFYEVFASSSSKMGFKGGKNFSRNGSFKGGGGRNRSFGGKDRYDAGPPDTLQELGFFAHPCQSQLVVKSNIEQVPYFNAPLYLENKEQIGKVDEIFGPIRDYVSLLFILILLDCLYLSFIFVLQSVSVTLSDNYKASSFPVNQKIFIDPNKLLPLQKFLPKPPENKIAKKKVGKGGDFGGGKKRVGRSFGGRRSGGGDRGGGFERRNSRGGGGGGRGGGRGRGSFRGRR